MRRGLPGCGIHFAIMVLHIVKLVTVIIIIKIGIGSTYFVEDKVYKYILFPEEFLNISSWCYQI